MKVSEFLELLAKCSPDEEVEFHMYSGCCGDTEELEFKDSDTFDYASSKETKAGIVRVAPQIYFSSLPGYRSCRQVGATLRAHKEYWKKHEKM